MEQDEKNIEKKVAAKRLLRISFVLLVIVGVLDMIGIKLYLYWSVHYYDSVVHFLAGITVGLGSLWLWLNFSKKELTQKRIFIVAFIGAIIVGVIWEIFEVTNGITFFSDGIHYVTDTGSDLLMDICGGVVASMYARRVILKNIV